MTGNTDEMKRFMERLEKSNAGQEKYAKLQYRMSQITALPVSLFSVLSSIRRQPFIPRVNTLFNDI